MVKYLFISIKSVAQILFTTPAIRCLKQQGDEAEIHFLTKPEFAEVIQANPYVHKIHVLSQNFEQTIKNLKEEEFDYVIDFQNELKKLDLQMKLKTPLISIKSKSFAKWLFENLKINKLPKIHLAERYIEAILFFIDKNDQKGLDLFISENNLVDLQNLNINTKTQRFIAICLGSAPKTIQIPLEKLFEICNKLPAPVVLLGNNDCIEIAEKLLQNTDNQVFSLVGKLNIQQTASVIQQANAVLTSDPDFMQIAAAVNERLISVWGSSAPQFGNGPYLPEKELFFAGVDHLKCRPCSEKGRNNCPKGHFRCMTELNVNGIIEKINEWLKMK